MRQRQAILRQIVEQNLDPNVPHVVGKNGTLVPKKPNLAPEVEKNETHKKEDEAKKTKEEKAAPPVELEVTTSEEKSEKVATEVVEPVKEEQASPEVVAVETSPSKSPFKKKKVSVTDG